MGDLKNEFQRTQGEITYLSGNIGNIQNDITEIKNENKKLMSYIQNYKNIIRDIEERKARRNKDKKKIKIDKINRLSTLVQSVSNNDTRTETAIVGQAGGANFELNKIEKITSNLNMLFKSSNMLDILTMLMTKLK